MYRRGFLAGLAGIAACPVCTRLARADAEWNYINGDPHGPSNWYKYYPACGAPNAAETQQSPVEIDTGAIRASLPPLAFKGNPLCTTMVNNGHTIQVQVAPGGTLFVTREMTYELVQFHFHAPSEHTMAGKRAQMEIHFVYTKPGNANAYGVIGAFMSAGAPNALFAEIMRAPPPHTPIPAPPRPALNLLPARLTGRYTYYAGSLTTPPCDETVDWFVLADDVRVEQTDIQRFTGVFPLNPGTARPIQDLNRRFVLRNFDINRPRG